MGDGNYEQILIESSKMRNMHANPLASAVNLYLVAILAPPKLISKNFDCFAMNYHWCYFILSPTTLLNRKS